MPFAAVKCNVYVPPLPGAGVPLSTPSAAMNLTPLGRTSVWLSDNVGTGKPLVLTIKVPADPTVNVVAPALIMSGADSTVSAFVADLSAVKPAALAVCTETAYCPPAIDDVVVNVQFPDPSLASCESIPSVNVVPATVTCNRLALSTEVWSQVPVRMGWSLVVVSELIVGATGAAVSINNWFVVVELATLPAASAVWTDTV